LNYTKLDAEKESGARDIRRPEDTLNLSASLQASEKLSTHLSVLMVQNTVDTNFTTLQDVPLDDYTLVNLSGQYTVSPRLSVSAKLNNALDDDYQTALGYGAPERTFSLAVTSRF